MLKTNQGNKEWRRNQIGEFDIITLTSPFANIIDSLSSQPLSDREWRRSRHFHEKTCELRSDW